MPLPTRFWVFIPLLMNKSMQPEDFFNLPSVERWMSRFEKLGGKTEIQGNKLILRPGPIPIFIAEVFAEQIRSIDFYGVAEVIVQ